MGSTCGGVTSACCSHDVSVDIKNQVDNGNNPRLANQKSFVNINSSGLKQKPIDVKEIQSLPKNSAERQRVEKLVSKVNAYVKGHITRCKYKRIVFLNLLTGQKAH